MKYTLPKIDDSIPALTCEWFPSIAQCFVYRNWGTVTLESLAIVLECGKADIIALAEAMGLSVTEVESEWQTRGYITIIRNNWHLLDYKQLCQLLGWDEARLAASLCNDDFLSIKLGRNKPYCPHIKIEALNDEGKKRTAVIKHITEGALSHTPKAIHKPFDFFGGLKEKHETMCSCDHGMKKIIYSYCTLYGDMFADTSLIDASFPAEMLNAYRECGITGVWVPTTLKEICPYIDNVYNDTLYEKRIVGIQYLIKRLSEYSIKLYIYLNEPRSVSNDFFEVHPDFRGERLTEDESCLCIRNDDVQSYLISCGKFIAENLPTLGGIYTITASENHTNCYSHIKINGECNCPRCKNFTRADNFALVNKLIYQGISSVSNSIEFIAHSWGWRGEEPYSVIDALPEKIEIMSVSEHHAKKNIDGTETKVIDYSISIEGPGEFSTQLWKYAKENNHKTIAKIQVNNSWELSTVPYIPVFDKVYRHVKGIIEQETVDGLMLSWTLGGYPSPMIEMVSRLCDSGVELPTLADIYNKLFNGFDIDLLARGFSELSNAFDEYPFSLAVVYHGPQQIGPANLLYNEATGRKATMVGFPYDDIEGWRGAFSVETYIGQLKKMYIKWEEGIRILRQAYDHYDKKLEEVICCAEACLVIFHSCYNQAFYISERDKKSDKSSILRSEMGLAKDMLALMAKNACIGYESSNQYHFTKSNLLEKIVNCDYLLKNIDDCKM